MASGDKEERPAGIEMREAHFPGRAPIDAYGNGGFRFADMSHRGSILCLPSGVYGITMYLVTLPFILWARRGIGAARA